MARAPEVAMRRIKAWLETETPETKATFFSFKCNFKHGV